MKNRTLGIVLVCALVSVTFFNFCRYTMMPMDMTDCPSNQTNCPFNLAQHQASFFQLFPAVASRTIVSITFVILALWLVISFKISPDQFFLKPFFYRQKIFIAAPALLLAFRRGILNPKIF